LLKATGVKCKVLHIAICFITLATVTGCQKELHFDAPPPVIIPPPPDSTYIDKIKYLLIDRNGLDTFSFIQKFNYDGAKRLTSIIYDSCYVNIGNLLIHTFSYQLNFYYNGADTLSYQMYSVFDDSKYPSGRKDTTVTHYFYTNNKLAKDSTVYSVEVSGQHQKDTTVNTYSYGNNRIYARLHTRLYDQLDTLQLDENENIIRSRTHNANGGLRFESFITYDNKRNPLRRFKPFYKYIIRGPEPIEGPMASLGNYTSIKNLDINPISGLSIPLVNASYTYQYNLFDYPVRQTLNGLLLNNKEELTFFYKSL
jgi:hypothetical protein